MHSKVFWDWYYLVMIYTTKSNFTEYKTWFSKNINTIDYKNYIDENTFSNKINEKFYYLSSEKLVIGSNEKLIERK